MQLLHRSQAWIIATRLRIYAVLVLFSVIPLTLFLYSADRYLRKATIRQIAKQSTEASDLAAGRFEERFSAATTLLESFATRPSIVQACATNRYDQVSGELKQAHSMALGSGAVVLFGVDGKPRAIYPAAQSDRYWRWPALPWYTEGLKSPTTYVSDVLTQTNGREAEIAIALPVKDATGHVLGLLTTFYPTDSIRKWAAGLGTNMSRFVFLVDRAGNAVSSENLSLRTRNGSFRQLEPVQRVISGNTGAGTFELGGHHYQAAYKPVASIGWGVVVAVPDKDVEDAVSQFERPLTVIAITFLLAAVGLGSLVANLWRRLRDSEQQTRSVIETAQDGFVAFDEKGGITDWNHQAEYIFGWAPEEAIGSSVQKLLIPERLLDRQWESLIGFHTPRRGSPLGRRLELIATHRSGHEFPAEVSIAVVLNERKRHFNAFFRDITEQQEYKSAIEQKNRELGLRNREVERANQLKSQFLASMSHELRTPLNAILGFSELLGDNSGGPLTEKQARWVEHIRKGGKHLLQLINDILDLAKIEAGQVELDIESFEAGSALPEVISNIRHLALLKKLNLEIHCSPDLQIQADRLRFKQILYNLLSNAIKFTPEGGSIRVEGRAAHGQNEFVISDTGVGIAPEDLDVIFDEFRQVRKSTGDVREGTGLGLAITKRLVQQQNGSIKVESTVGQGTSFVFTLPSADRPAETGTPNLQARAVEAERPLVLIVDDEPAACELIASYLHPEGYSTAIARSGVEAVKLARELKPRCVTLDILMPRGSGWETLHELRQHSDTKTIPIIVVSVVDQRRLGMALGASDYLVKPVQREMLLAAIERHVLVRGQTKLHCVAADDDPATLRLVADALTETGFSIDLATNGREAIAAMRAKHTDLLLLDLVMPEMSGFEVLEYVADDPGLCNVPTVVLTAKNLSRQEIELLDRTARTVLQKNGEWRGRLLQNLQKLVGQSGHIKSEGQ